MTQNNQEHGLRSLTLTRPDDWHVHLRDTDMPNLSPPITTTAQALAYRRRVLAAVPGGLRFEPLMTLYLTDNTPPPEIAAGATTHSQHGVTDIRRCDAALAAMEEHDLPLLVHGEVTDPSVDVFDREWVFIERHLIPLLERYSRLRVVLEQITTRQAVEFIIQAHSRVAATITAHHLLLNRMFTGGVHPHHYCLPVLKREEAPIP